MAINYTDNGSIVAYGELNGGLAGTTIQPQELAMIDTIIASASRMIDNHCYQAFSLATYTNQILRAQITIDGSLQCWPAVPTMSTPTAASFRVLPTATWTSIDTSLLDITPSNSGCRVMVLSNTLGLPRVGSTIQMRLSYSGGWTASTIPTDFSYAATALCWWLYQKRSAPMERTAIPEMGILVIPGKWPSWLMDVFQPFVRTVVL